MWEFKPRILAKSPGLRPLGGIDVFRRVRAKVAGVGRERQKKLLCFAGLVFLQQNQAIAFKKYGLFDQIMLQNFSCLFHCYWPDMFQGSNFLGIWQILHVGKGTAYCKRPTSPWKIRWKNKLHPHMPEHAYEKRASSKKFLRKTWMIVMTFYPNIQ